MTADRRLAGAFTAEVVRKLASPLVIERGAAYLRDGRVEPEESSGDRFKARVRGTMPYTVELWVEGGELGWSCTCPGSRRRLFLQALHSRGLIVERGCPAVGCVAPGPG